MNRNEEVFIGIKGNMLLKLKTHRAGEMPDKAFKKDIEIFMD